MPRVEHINIDKELFRRLIHELNISREELADKCGVTLDGLNYWLRTGRIPLSHWETIKVLLGRTKAKKEAREFGLAKDMEMSKVNEALDKITFQFDVIDAIEKTKSSPFKQSFDNVDTDDLVSELEKRGYTVTLTKGKSITPLKAKKSKRHR
jgi:transcriptional regulator with XRE-family HTH domain